MAIDKIYVHEESDTMLCVDSEIERFSPFSWSIIGLARGLILLGSSIWRWGNDSLKEEDVFVENGKSYQENINAGIYVLKGK